jgi:MYXO-CTERM domain-containing protein
MGLKRKTEFTALLPLLGVLVLLTRRRRKSRIVV